MARGDFGWGDFVWGGFVRGDFVRGDFVRGDFVLEPLSIEACGAIRPGLNGYISMIISVDTLCGFAPL